MPLIRFSYWYYIVIIEHYTPASSHSLCVTLLKKQPILPSSNGCSWVMAVRPEHELRWLPVLLCFCSDFFLSVCHPVIKTILSDNCEFSAYTTSNGVLFFIENHPGKFFFPLAKKLSFFSCLLQFLLSMLRSDPSSSLQLAEWATFLFVPLSDEWPVNKIQNTSLFCRHFAIAKNLFT